MNTGYEQVALSNDTEKAIAAIVMAIAAVMASGFWYMITEFSPHIVAAVGVAIEYIGFNVEIKTMQFYAIALFLIGWAGVIFTVPVCLFMFSGIFDEKAPREIVVDGVRYREVE